jgi:hypothetical protein
LDRSALSLSHCPKNRSRRIPPEGSALSINEWHAMIFACSVVKSQTLDVWIADENGVRVADRNKIADFANTHGYL